MSNRPTDIVKPAVTQAAIADYSEQLKQANEKLYEHSHDLVIRNKTLSLLRQLYQISIQSLESEKLAEQIVAIVRTELEFEMVGIMTYDQDTSVLTPICFSKSERVDKEAAAFGFPFSTTLITHATSVPFLVPVFKGNEAHTTDIGELWRGFIPDDALKIIAESGHIHELSVQALRIEGAVQGILILGLNRPITELSKFERESIDSLVDVVAIALDRARLYEEIKKANEQQVILLHFITHQIKGFVAKSRNIFSMILEGDFGPVPETMRPMVEEGFKSDTKGANTIQEILNAANIKSGKVTYTTAPYDLKDLTAEIIKDLKPASDAKGLVLSLNADGGPFISVGDRSQMLNALKNLIDNSIKYTPSGSVIVSLSCKDDKIRFQIKDTGVGITLEDMAHLFTEGGHGKESQKINVDSTGFGLYIVKNIIEAHHGKVWAESEGPGKGSTFIVELPV
jgi:signal transduction histidine kinase